MEETIKRLRYNILIHSFLYYKLDSPIISDAEFDKRCRDLVEIGFREIGFYDDKFRDFTGDTGYHFEYDSRIIDRALYVLKLYERRLTDSKSASQ